jgi:DNA-binding transcriptional regulator GbsR (MarR family)
MKVTIKVEKRAKKGLDGKKAIIVETEKNYFEFYTNDVNEDVEVEIDNRKNNIYRINYLCKKLPEEQIIMVQ